MQTGHHASKDLKESARKSTKHPQVQAFEKWKADSLTGTAKLQNKLDETLYLAFCAGIQYAIQHGWEEELIQRQSGLQREF